MTVTKKTINVPQKQQEIIDYVTCDLCGIKGDDEINWPNDDYNVIETEINIVMGDRYPESGDGTKIQYHICPECFKNKLMIWLREQGAIPTETTWGLLKG